KNVHEQVGQQICQRDEGYLDGQLVDALLHGYLVVGLYLLGAQGLFLDLHELYLSPALLDVQMYNATYARAQKAQGRDGKAEALAADKAEVVFKNAAIVERLAGALAVAKGQQDARRREKARDHQSRDYRDAKAEHRLEQICRDG